MSIKAPIESECRRPSFRADVPVVLSDGVTWHLPKPRLLGRWIRFDGEPEPGDPDGPGSRAVAVGVTDFGAEFDFRAEEALINNFNRRMTNAELYWLGRELLLKNYRLSDRDFYYILRIATTDDEDNARMWNAIFATACGLMLSDEPSPKAASPAPGSPAGSGVPSSPTASTPAA